MFGPSPHWSRYRTVLLGLLLFAAAGCSTQSPLVRNNPVARSLFYPPAVGSPQALGADTEGAAFDYTDYARVLAAYVDDEGRVNYGALAERTQDLDAFLERLADAKMDDLSRHAQLALLLNAYNAFTLKLLVEHPGVESIMDIPAGSRWKPQRWSLAGQLVSLVDLEHELIRRRFREPRIHFALVCASVGCPKLRMTPFTGRDLTLQLDEQTRDFFSQPRNLQWDAKRSLLKVSELVDWYRGDFGGDKTSMILFVSRFLPAVTEKAVRSAGRHVRLGYLPYDWSLNGTW